MKPLGPWAHTVECSNFDSLNTFKKQLKAHLFRWAFYSSYFILCQIYAVLSLPLFCLLCFYVLYFVKHFVISNL